MGITDRTLHAGCLPSMTITTSHYRPRAVTFSGIEEMTGVVLLLGTAIRMEQGFLVHRHRKSYVFLLLPYVQYTDKAHRGSTLGS
jgi:hypothetical protein